MNKLEYLQAAAEHLVLALSFLDRSGAQLTAAQVDGALACLKQEAWNNLLASTDYAELDAMCDELYANHMYLEGQSPK